MVRGLQEQSAPSRRRCTHEALRERANIGCERLALPRPSALLVNRAVPWIPGRTGHASLRSWGTNPVPVVSCPPLFSSAQLHDKTPVNDTAPQPVASVQHQVAWSVTSHCHGVGGQTRPASSLAARPVNPVDESGRLACFPVGQIPPPGERAGALGCLGPLHSGATCNLRRQPGRTCLITRKLSQHLPGCPTSHSRGSGNPLCKRSPGGCPRGPARLEILSDVPGNSTSPALRLPIDKVGVSQGQVNAECPPFYPLLAVHAAFTQPAGGAQETAIVDRLFTRTVGAVS